MKQESSSLTAPVYLVESRDVYKHKSKNLSKQARKEKPNRLDREAEERHDL